MSISALSEWTCGKKSQIKRLEIDRVKNAALLYI